MISICDFEDSFTYNILSELKLLGLACNVVAFKDVFIFLQSLVDTDKKHVVILGPGPGHPRDYRQYENLIQDLLKNKNLFIMGICLGHQLILESLGYSIEHCRRPIHGESRKIKLSKAWAKRVGQQEIEVQFYNSLVPKTNNIVLENVEVFAQEDEVLMACSEGFVSYQFHPESLGTSCPQRFFGCIRDFLYNN
jgi:anthranilate/para-aminobenzoate synthase component II